MLPSQPPVRAADAAPSNPQPSKRTSSLPMTQGNTSQASLAPPSGTSVQSTVRHYRSMLDVDEPPRIGPWNPMSFDQLYTGPNVPDGARSDLGFLKRHSEGSSAADSALRARDSAR